MRSSKSRSRGNKNRTNRPSGGNIINRVFDSSGPDGKVRGTPQQIIEKYNQLHRDAWLAGDRVAAENFAQHAEHYTRMLAEAMREVERAREEMDAQNRERQAERDRERAARLRAQEEVSGGSGPQPELPVEAERPQRSEQPERQDGGERQEPRRDRRDRRERRPEAESVAEPAPELPSFITGVIDLPEPEGEDDSGLVETPEEQAPAPEAPRKPRARKPRAKREGDGSDKPAEAAE